VLSDKEEALRRWIEADCLWHVARFTVLG